MAGQLPPSKFGAGTTYGDSGQSHALPPTAPPPPVAPQQQPYPPPAVPYSAPIHQPPAAPNLYPPPTPDIVSTPQYAGTPSYPHQADAPAVLTAGGTSGGTAIGAAVLSLIGAVWYAIDTIRSWDSLEYVFSALDDLSRTGLSSSATAWAYGSVAAIVAQFILVVLLLLGSILLIARVSAGRVLAICGSVLVLAANAFWALKAFQLLGWQIDNEFAGKVLLNTGLPAVIAIIALVLLCSGSTKLWCRKVGTQMY